MGAPTGSIYHRFASRDVLLATVWLRAAAAFQDAVFERLSGAVPREAGLKAALYMAKRVREEPREARLLLLHRRDDFVDRGWPATFRRRAARLAQQIETELHAFRWAPLRPCGRAYGSDGRLRGDRGAVRGNPSSRRGRGEPSAPCGSADPSHVRSCHGPALERKEVMSISENAHLML